MKPSVHVEPRDNSQLPDIVRSKRVETEYDVFPTRRLGLTSITLSDDRGRRFQGLTLNRAFQRAERAQDPTDPIHHPPFPSPAEVPLP